MTECEKAPSEKALGEKALIAESLKTNDLDNNKRKVRMDVNDLPFILIMRKPARP
jgi:hypothetical protein